MRSTTAGELAVLASKVRVVTPRVKVANGSGTMIDITSWQERVTWDQDNDQPVSAATVDLRRDSGTILSFAPYRTDSTLNRLDDGVTYSPLVFPGRKITIEVATTALGAAIAGGDYKLHFEGTVESVAWERSPVSIRCRDRGGRLVDRWVQFAYPQGGVDLAVSVQAVYDAWVGTGSSVPFPETIYIPVAPAEFINAYQQQPMRVMDALQALADVKAWDIRYKWDDGTSAFRLTLYEPPRSKTTPDYTFGPSDYLDITSLDIDRLSIRNFIEVQYPDIGPPKSRGSVAVSDSTSITNFDLQYQLISLADYSPISNGTQATAMANGALSDLKDPKANHQLETHFFWPVELGDLIRHTPNAVHYNANQDFAVIRIEHELSAGHHRTRLTTRSSVVSGGQRKWTGPLLPIVRPVTASIYDQSGNVLLDPSTAETTADLTVLGVSIETHGVGPTQSQSRSRCKLTNSADWTTAHNTALVLGMDTEIYDVSSLHDTVTNNSRITIPTGGNVGTWLFVAQVQWVSNATGTRSVAILKNGFQIARTQIAAASGLTTIQMVSAIDDAPSVGDYYEVSVLQTSGGALNVNGLTTASSYFSAIHLW